MLLFSIEVADQDSSLRLRALFQHDNLRRYCFWLVFMPSAAVPCSDIRANGLGQAHRDLPQCDRPSFKVFVPAPCWTSPRRRARAPGRRPGRRRLPAPPVPGQIQDRDGGRDPAWDGPGDPDGGRGAHDAAERATERQWSP